MIGIFTGVLMQLGFLTGVMVSVAGGMAGVLFYTYAWESVKQFYRRYFPASQTRRNDTNAARKRGPSLKERIIDKVRANFGLAGIAFLTPLFLTVPVGTFAALALTNQKRRIFFYMFVAFLGWSSLFFGLSHFFSDTIAKLARDFVH